MIAWLELSYCAETNHLIYRRGLTSERLDQTDDPHSAVPRTPGTTSDEVFGSHRTSGGDSAM